MVILTKACGKRLYPLKKSEYVPKGLIKAQGHPVLWYTTTKLEKTNVEEVIIVANQLNEPFYKKYIKNLVTSKDYTLITERISNFDRPLGVGETIETVVEKENIKSDLLVLPCDNIFTYDLQQLINFYKQLKYQDVVSVYKLNNISALGQRAVIRINKNNQIISYENRPKKPLE